MTGYVNAPDTQKCFVQVKLWTSPKKSISKAKARAEQRRLSYLDNFQHGLSLRHSGNRHRRQKLAPFVRLDRIHDSSAGITRFMQLVYLSYSCCATASGKLNKHPSHIPGSRKNDTVLERAKCVRIYWHRNLHNALTLIVMKLHPRSPRNSQGRRTSIAPAALNVGPRFNLSGPLIYQSSPLPYGWELAGADTPGYTGDR